MAPLRLNNGTILSNDADKAEALNAYFAFLFTPITSGSYPSDIPCLIISISQLVDFFLQTVLSALRQAKYNFSSGPNSIPSIFLLKFASVLVFLDPSFLILQYNLSKLPDDWKHTLVIPVYKKGEASVVNSYRPISLTCPLCKVMGSIIKDNNYDVISF